MAKNSPAPRTSPPPTVTISQPASKPAVIINNPKNVNIVIAPKK